MYRCETCSREFEYPERERELLGEYYKTVDACPFCHSDVILPSVFEDIYGDFIYQGDTYYDFSNGELVLETNIKRYLSDCEVQA